MEIPVPGLAWVNECNRLITTSVTLNALRDPGVPKMLRVPQCSYQFCQLSGRRGTHILAHTRKRLWLKDLSVLKALYLDPRNPTEE
jgi:hypothetical protein